MPDNNRTRTAKAREHHILGRSGRGCAICGGCSPVLANLGLHESHIVSGVNKIENKVFLCARCAEAFDRVLKPLIWNALRLYAGERLRTIGLPGRDGFAPKISMLSASHMNSAPVLVKARPTRPRRLLNRANES